MDIVDSGGNILHRFDSLQAVLVKDSSLVVVCHKDSNAWEDSQVWIKIVRVRTLKPIAELNSACRWLWKDFKGWNRSTI